MANRCTALIFLNRWEDRVAKVWERCPVTSRGSLSEARLLAPAVPPPGSQEARSSWRVHDMTGVSEQLCGARRLQHVNKHLTVSSVLSALHFSLIAVLTGTTPQRSVPAL